MSKITKNLSSCEFVTSAHPDRLCDNLAAIIINDVQKQDGPNSHAAIEVFLTHDTVTFSGEATTSLKFTYDYLLDVLVKGFERSGYYNEMRKYWTKEEVALPIDLEIINKISAQSPDIALGTTDQGKDSGWNDQGVYFSSADVSNEFGIGYPMLLASEIGEALKKESKASIFDGANRSVILGPDIKTVVTCRVEEDGFTPIEVTAVTIAVAHTATSPLEGVRALAKKIAEEVIASLNVKIADDCEWVINGTGRFVIHGCISDTSMTGRKISVSHPSAGPLWCNKMIGGGSLIKPWHASDLILNLAARYVARCVTLAGISTYAVVGCAGAIGQRGLQSLFIKGDDEFEKSKNKDKVLDYFANEIVWTPYYLAALFGFFTDKFDFGEVVDKNFFGIQESWEGPEVSVLEKLKEIFYK